MDAGIPLATILRWLGHHNISQTNTYLGASLCGDEREMRTFEERIGRMAKPQDVESGIAATAGNQQDAPVPASTTIL